MHGELKDLATRLRALPDEPAPAGVWERALAARAARRPSPARLPLALAATALVAVAGLAWLATTQTGGGPTAEIEAAAADPLRDALRAENARLEAMLAALPERAAMRGSTAYTVAQLEDRLAWVDDHLSLATLEPHAPEQAELLWRERVELMNTLVQVRYADLASSL